MILEIWLQPSGNHAKEPKLTDHRSFLPLLAKWRLAVKPLPPPSIWPAAGIRRKPWPRFSVNDVTHLGPSSYSHGADFVNITLFAKALNGLCIAIS